MDKNKDASIYEDTNRESGGEETNRESIQSQLRRRRIRQEWFVYTFLCILVLIYHSLNFGSVDRVYQLNESMKKINRIVRIAEFHNEIEVTGDIDVITSSTMLIQISNLLFQQFNEANILNANKHLAASALNQFRVLDQKACHETSILSPFDYDVDTGVSLDTSCTSCSLICNSYYDKKSTRSLEPYYDYATPFIVTVESEVSRIEGKYAKYDKDAFQATRTMIENASDVYTLAAFGNVSALDLNASDQRAYAVLSDWIDEKTRALSMSTLFYNMNMDMLVSLTTLWEFTLVGNLDTTVRAESFDLYYSIGGATISLLVLISALVLCVMYVFCFYGKCKYDSLT